MKILPKNKILIQLICSRAFINPKLWKHPPPFIINTKDIISVYKPTELPELTNPYSDSRHFPFNLKCQLSTTLKKQIIKLNLYNQATPDLFFTKPIPPRTNTQRPVSGNLNVHFSIYPDDYQQLLYLLTHQLPHKVSVQENTRTIEMNQ